MIEYEILMFIRENLTSPIMDKIMIFITQFGNGGIFWTILSLILIIPKKTRKTGIFMFLSLALGYIFGNLLIKNIVARPRPFVKYNVPIIVPTPSEFSFPSGHTLCSFSPALCLHSYNKVIGTFAIIFAFLIAFSRLYLFVHYPTDILGGILLSMCMVYMARKILDAIYKKKGISTDY